MTTKGDPKMHETGAKSASASDRVFAAGTFNRRRFLRMGAMSALGGRVAGFDLFGRIPADAAVPIGKMIGVLEFADENVAPAGTLLGSELDGRLYTDLSRVAAKRVVTPTSEFYVRTAASRLLPNPGHWGVGVAGRGGEKTTLDVGTLRRSARTMGTHLMECAGNVRLTRFGLISVADWNGIAIEEVLDRARTKAGKSWGIEISGFDEYAGHSATSIPGASWIFPTEALRNAHAFLATGMNGQWLRPNHGAPVRLVVPGWYGCCCIKWVNRIAFVDEEAEATSQMKEYAIRTLQEGIPEMARDFAPATIDHAALPVRIEKWIVSGKLKYRVAGIIWGGTELVRRLQIRFNPEEEFVDVEGFRQVKTDPWTVWTHMWSPRKPGQYTIRLAVSEPPVRARKLNLGLYDRSVNISEI